MAFTPVSALIGGALIGISASMMLGLNGRVAGISGILGGALRPRSGEWGWRAAFLGGLFIGGLTLLAFVPGAIPRAGGESVVLPILAGLLVGLGTEIGSGCTSGHGVCGISRFSMRSIVATVTFVAMGMASTFVVRHLL